MSQTLNFLVSREYKGEIKNNKSAYYIKKGTMFLINCGKGVVDAMRRTKVLTGVREVFIAITCSNKDHLADLKKLLTVLSRAGVKAYLLDTISLNKKLLKKMGISDGEDCKFLEPLSNGINWINFLATPHKNKDFSCPIELYLDGKTIFYGSDAGSVPFSIKGYDEYYFDFADKKSEYALSPEKFKRLVQKNSIKKSSLWLVHLESVKALETAQKFGARIAREEDKKLTQMARKQQRRAAQMQR